MASMSQTVNAYQRVAMIGHHGQDQETNIHVTNHQLVICEKKNVLYVLCPRPPVLSNTPTQL